MTIKTPIPGVYYYGGQRPASNRENSAARAFAFMSHFARTQRASTDVGYGGIVTESDGVKELRLYGAIGEMFGIGAVQVARALDENDIGVVRINSPGGDVFDGITIANQIAQAGLPVIVDGIAASIASVIAASTHSLTMLSGAFLMVHSPWSAPIGNADDLRREAATLDKIADTMAGLYARKAGTVNAKLASRAHWLGVMAAETWFDAAESVDNGLADVAHELTAPGVTQARAFNLSAYLPRVPAALLASAA